ncbi:hypothetical protein Tsubulata_050406, partial [Turnera subulata]
MARAQKLVLTKTRKQKQKLNNSVKPPVVNLVVMNMTCASDDARCNLFSFSIILSLSAIVVHTAGRTYNVRKIGALA